MFAYFIFFLMVVALIWVLAMMAAHGDCRCQPAAPTLVPAEVTRVETETAALLSSLRSIMHKGALVSRTGRSFDIATEREAISDFAASRTGLAYSAWIDERCSAALKDGGAEPWSRFFQTLTEIGNMTNACLAAIGAADIELLFDGLTDDDIRRIACFNAGILDTIASISESRAGSATVSVFADIARVLRDNRAQIHADLVHLRNSGVADPNVDFFLAAIEGNENEAMAALSAGADPEAGNAAALLRRYEKELKTAHSHDARLDAAANRHLVGR